MARALMVGSLFLTVFTVGCTHRVEVAATEPITINLNVKIEHEVKVKVEKELDELFSDESNDLF